MTRALACRAGLPVLLAALGSCKKEEPNVVYYPQAAPTTGPGAPAGVPPPGVGTPVPMHPAVGFVCGSDQEIQCPFGRCLGGRCGGCTTSAECKPGAQCLPTWLGAACLPGAAPAPAPPAAPPATAPPAGVPVPPVTPAPNAAPFERARAICVEHTNGYRARVGAAPVVRTAAQEACGDAEAASDAATRRVHGAFGRCGERAQNECPGWDGPIESVIERCLAMMFAEGPGPGPEHGHYMNMTDRRYRGVACGIATEADGSFWVVQNFYP